MNNELARTVSAYALSEEKIDQEWNSLDGFKMHPGQCPADWDRARRVAFARAIERALAAPVAAQAGQVMVPAGFVLVPESPTAEMFEAASVPRRLNWDSLSIWKAMVEAAPSPASESLRSPQEAAGTEKGVAS